VRVKMKAMALVFGCTIMFAEAANAEKYVQTICFAKSSCTDKYAFGMIGDNVNICGGQCQGKKLAQMNASGWRLIQIFEGVQSSFGMIFEKKIK